VRRSCHGVAPGRSAALCLPWWAMSTLMRPVGTREPQVYWRRRVVALVALVLVVALLVWGVTSVVGALRGGDDPATDGGATTAQEPAPEPATDPQPSADPSAATTESAPAEDEVPACAAPALVVAPTADATSYALGATATIGMTITNTGPAPCSMDAGSAALELLVVSGADRIWSSDDCQTDAQSRPTTVEPGEAGVLASSVEWTLVRSAEGCANGLPELRAGTYQLTARAGEITSEPLAFQVTG
jgi:hypothetical protein